MLPRTALDPGVSRSGADRNLGPRGHGRTFRHRPRHPQTLMKAIGEVQPVGAAHFVERDSLLSFLDAMIDAPDFDQAFRDRVRVADLPPSTRKYS